MNENKKPVVAKAFSWPSVKRVQLNHYWTRSVQDWQEKMARGRADIGTYDRKTAKKFAGFARAARVEDRTAAKFGARVKEMLKVVPTRTKVTA